MQTGSSTQVNFRVINDGKMPNTFVKGADIYRIIHCDVGSAFYYPELSAKDKLLQKVLPAFV
ncbi:hypothetical protein WA026_015127 [Henosepilachna vigintioctopunctata]|uniref:Uncharacterized protein n=1 Tax=Henosepilachna vigintioctopunctata TaxID=420089 RepID=A0AAW1TTY8_9CUCU